MNVQCFWVVFLHATYVSSAPSATLLKCEG